MLVQPPVVLLRRPCAGIQRGARPIVDDAMVLVEIRAKHPVLIDLQMQEIQPVYCFNVCWAGSAVFFRSVG